MITRLNFNIVDTHSFKTLGIQDTSWYNSDLPVTGVTLEIKPPGTDSFKSPYFKERALNVYNSNNVGITKVTDEEDLTNLPDGIWEIKYSICPNNKLYISKFFLKTDRIQCRYSQAFLTLDFSQLYSDTQSKKRNSLATIDLLIQGAISASNNKDTSLALKLYKKADNLLDRFGDCDCA